MASALESSGSRRSVPALDAPFTETMQAIMKQPGVTGVLFADANGLCIGAVGTAKPSLSGFLTKVVSQATNIEPTVAVSNDEHTILVHKADDLTVAIFKDQS